MTNAPPSGAELTFLKWAKSHIDESDAFLRSQEGYNKIGETIRAIMSSSSDLRSPKLSSTTDNHVGKLQEDLAGYLTDVKPFWEYKTYNNRFKTHAENYGRLSQHWWLAGSTAHKGADLEFLNVVKYALLCTGYAHLTYSDKWGDVVIEAEDPRDVLPIRPGSLDTIQDAYGVVIRRARTVNYVRSLTIAKGKENRIQATRDGAASQGTETRFGQLMEWLGSPFRQRLFSSDPARQMHKIPTLDLYTMYLADESKNESGRDVYMGEWHKVIQPDCIECIYKTPHPVTNWSYKVAPGQPLYPNKRLIIFTDTVVLYDGPSPYWHGLFPVVKLTLNPQPWTWLGKGVLWDLLPLQRALDRSLRIVDDNLEKVARPDIIADKNSIGKAFLDKIDTRKAGGKYHTNPLAGKGFQIVPPPPLPREVYDHIQFCIQEMDKLSGAIDMSSLMKLKQLPEGDTIEKIMGSMSASVRLRSRVIENFMKEFAQILAFNFSQFYTLPMRLAVLGEKGVTFEDFDFDPGNMIPDFVHREDMDPLTGIPTPEAVTRGVRPKMERAKSFLQQFTYQISPSSLLASSAIENQMKYLQLARAGWMDIWSLYEVLDIPNGGNPPEGANTIPERLAAQGEMGLGMNVNPAGRKASGQTAPRTVVKES